MIDEMPVWSGVKKFRKIKIDVLLPASVSVHINFVERG